jgi:hypothetical protein
MASYSLRKLITKSLKLDPTVSMTPRDPTFFCQSSPLIFTFSSNYRYMYVMFCYGFPLIRAQNHFCKGSHGVIKISAYNCALVVKVHISIYRNPKSKKIGAPTTTVGSPSNWNIKLPHYSFLQHTDMQKGEL